VPTEIQTEEATLELLTQEPDPRRGRAVAIQRVAERAGLMPPLHRRDEDERYRVLEGELTFYVGDEVVRAGAGEVVVAPRGVRRTFRVESEWARWLVVTRVRSAERFEDFGRALARPAAGWPSPDEVAAVAAIGSANGIEVLGPPGSLPSER
jgi:mannose-6-phosphate isomerase-like protein (cupin superfamily)